MNVKTILVPLDGSNIAEAALTPAMEHRAGVRRQAGAAARGRRHTRGRWRIRSRRRWTWCARPRSTSPRLGLGWRPRASRDVEISVWYGPAVEAIVEAARYRNADLIVMSSHGRSGLGRLVLGSIAESVLRSTAVPILLIRPGGAPRRNAVRGRAPRQGDRPCISHKRVLVALDGSTAAEAVLRFLMEIAGPLDMTVLLLHVLEPIPPHGERGHVTHRRRHRDARGDDAERVPGAPGGPLRSQGVDATWSRCGSAGQPSEILAARARERRGSHRHGHPRPHRARAVCSSAPWPRRSSATHPCRCS